MKFTSNTHRQNISKLALINLGALLWLSAWLSYPLAAQTQSKRLQIHQIAQSEISSQSRDITYARLEIGGIKLSMPESEVRKALGQPLEVKNGYMTIAGKTRTLRYSGITIELLEDVEPTGKFSVYEIKTNSPRYVTKDGVKVGDRISKVISIYGRPEGSQTEGSDTLSYPVNHPTPAYLIFTIENGIVRTISCGDFLG